MFDKRVKLGDYETVYYAMKNLGRGTPEELQAML